MSLLDKIIHKEDEEDYIEAPVTGTIISMASVNDPVFASKLLGDGIAVVPMDGTIISPISGIISLIFDTKHAIAITADSGLELIVHVGIGVTVLEGKAFDVFVEKGQRVNAGDRLMKVDLQQLLDSSCDTVVVVVVTKDMGRTLSLIEEGTVSAGTPILQMK